MKGVILGICPQAQLVDLTHEIPSQTILPGAFLLKSVLEYFPRGTVHLAVVDPGVGGSRKAIAVKSRGCYFVGPDNGLIPAALEEWGVEEVVELTGKKYQLSKPSSTFHGRDLFAPVAAHLAKGVPFSKLGKKLTRWIVGEIPKPRKTPQGWEGEVLWVDHFGNLVTNLNDKHLQAIKSRKTGPASPFRLKMGKTVLLNLATRYSQVKRGTLIALMGSSGNLEISVNRGNASRKLSVGIGTPVVLC